MDERRPNSEAAAAKRAADASRTARGFKSGKPQATEVVRQRIRRILRYRGYGMPREERHDLEQEVMSQLWQAVNRPGADLEAGFWGLVEVVAARRSIDWLRRHRQHGELEEVADPAASPLARTISKERRRLAARALGRLPDACRELIRLSAGSNKSYREISALLGKSEGALRIQMHRCVKRAQEIIEELQRTGDRRSEGKRHR